MNLGIGVDIISVARIKKALKNKNFIGKLFTPQEVAYCRKRKNPEVYFAARFAAKEAVKKALAGKIKAVSWRDVEVLNNKDGSPKIDLNSSIRKKLKNQKILITLSHTKEYAIAVAFLMKK
ncbi:MAG: holo-[acyl-carrier-protein] synthase [candidate division Zixibacteria bacterium RBG_16_40_9]|nr:MAG: holo-[acyl-carrier-protein] synthase [candidate division Zixibacteria bacterium RBG_16_40_9]